MKNLEKSLIDYCELPPNISLFFEISRGFFKDMVDSSLIIFVARVLVYWFSGEKSVAIFIREGKWGTSGSRYELRYI